MHNVQNMHEQPAFMQEHSRPVRAGAFDVLLTATQVQGMLKVDRSTVYRMAEDGRLPAVKVGRQWRFPAAQIESLLGATQSEAPRQAPYQPTLAPLQAAVDVAAELLDVMVMVTDMDGNALTAAANPCARFEAVADDPDTIALCVQEWRNMADDSDVTPRFKVGPLDFECARAFVRAEHTLIAMVIAGGVAAPGDTSSDLHVLDARRRAYVLESLPRIAAALSKVSPRIPATF